MDRSTSLSPPETETISLLPALLDKIPVYETFRRDGLTKTLEQFSRTQQVPARTDPQPSIKLFVAFLSRRYVAFKDIYRGRSGAFFREFKPVLGKNIRSLCQDGQIFNEVDSLRPGAGVLASQVRSKFNKTTLVYVIQSIDRSPALLSLARAFEEWYEEFSHWCWERGATMNHLARTEIIHDDGFKDILCHLRRQKIPNWLFSRAARSSPAWSSNGEIIHMSPPKSLRSFLQGHYAALIRLKRQNYISVSREGQWPSEDFISVPGDELQISGDTRSLERFLLLLVCQAFPKESELDVLFGSRGRILIPILEMLQALLKLDTKVYQEEDELLCIAMALLSASHFGKAHQKEEKLDLAEPLINRLTSDAWGLGPRLELRRAYIGRLKEPALLQSLLHHRFSPSVSSAFYGLLILSDVTNMLHKNQLANASWLLEKYEFSKDPSELESHLVPRFQLMRARIKRYTGNFESARQLLESISATAFSLEESRMPMPLQCSIVCHLTAVKCELGEMRDGKSFEAYIAHCKSIGWYELPRAMNLKITLADAHLMGGKLPEANAEYQEILRTCDDIPTPEVTRFIAMRKAQALLGLIRTCSAVNDYDGLILQAHALWTYAATFCGKNGFTFMAAQMSLSFGYLKKGCLRESEETYKKTLGWNGGDQHWYTGVGSQWIPFLRNELSHKWGTS